MRKRILNWLTFMIVAIVSYRAEMMTMTKRVEQYLL